MSKNPSQKFLILLIILNSSQKTLQTTEITTLMEVKSSLDPQNRVLTTWEINGDPCSGKFDGIACNVDRKIANISLQGRGITGKLSPMIGKLKWLTGVYLHYNEINGEIPTEIGELNNLVDLYLNVNNFSGLIPSKIRNMLNLQVMNLGCNQLTGSIPAEIGTLKKLTVLSLHYNRFNGAIPASLGGLSVLKRLNLSYNHLSGLIPVTIANVQSLRELDVRNNSLSGNVPFALKRLEAGFSYENNSKLCGTGFHGLRSCSAFDNGNVAVIDTPQPLGLIINNHTKSPKNVKKTTRLKSSKSTKFPHIAAIVAAITASVIFAIAAFLACIKCRRQKQKVGSMIESCESRQISTDLRSKSASPLVSSAYTTGWDTEFGQDVLQNFRYNFEDIESATQYFSEANVLGRGKFSTVYKGVLRDESVVAIKSVSVNSCKSEEEELVTGLNLLVSLRHQNLVNFRGFCCSRGRGKCFLIYDFAINGSLTKYLDVSHGNGLVLDWPTRVRIINGIAQGLRYLHEENAGKPRLIHQNISAEKILLDEQFNPVIIDSGLRKILADDTIFSALKVSAAMGYLAPEYMSTGRFTEKSDVYAFGVIVLHVVSGKQVLTNAMRSSAESSTVEDFVDLNLDRKFSVSEAAKMVKLGLRCIHEVPEQRPNMQDVVDELGKKGCI